MKERGQSHIEAILAFVLFIGFVGVGVYFFHPNFGSRLADSSLDYATREIIKNLSSSIERYGVKLNNSGMGLGYIVLPTPNGLGGSGYAVRTETPSKAWISSWIDPFPPWNTNILWSGNLFVYVQYSTSYVSSNPSGFPLPPGSGTFASSDKRMVLTERQIRLLNETYYSRYTTVKKQINIPSQVDFGFRIVLPSETIIVESPIPQGVEVHSSSTPIEFLWGGYPSLGARNGSTEFGDLIVKVW